MMAEDCSVLDPRWFRLESLWMSEASARDNEALTRALQISLSDTSSSGRATPATSPSPSPATSSSPFLLHQNRQLAPSSAPLQPQNHPLGPAFGARVAKRKSRASKRSPTTYINADPANFREMVQRVTGIQVVENQPPTSDALVKPEPIRAAAPGSRAALQQLSLPTLDTSALWLANSVGSLGASLELPDFDADAFSPTFPTMESWGVM